MRYKVPDNIVSKKARVAYRVFREIMFFEIGRSIPSRILEPLMSILVILTFIKSYDLFTISKSWAWIIVFVAIIGFYYAGRFYAKHHLDKIDRQVHAERDPILHGVYNNTGKKGEKF